MGPPSPVRKLRSKGPKRERTIHENLVKSVENNEELDSDKIRPRVKFVEHEEEQLEFLDFYDEKSYGEMMLRRRKAVPDEHIHREDPNINHHARRAYTMQELAIHNGQPIREVDSEAGSPAAPPSFLGPNLDEYSLKKKEPTKLRDISKANDNAIEYVTLIRPARAIEARFEKPFTSKRFFDIANNLYPPLPTTSSKPPAPSCFRLYPFRGSGSFDVARLHNDPSDLNLVENLFNNFVSHILPRSCQVFLLVKEFESIRVQHGGNRASVQLWDCKGIHSTDPNSSVLSMKGLAKILAGFGIDVDTRTVALQVDRYKRELIEMRPYLNQDEFRREVFWKIDDPIINVFGDEQYMSENFIATETERTQRLVEDDRQLKNSSNNDMAQRQREEHRARMAERLQPTSVYGDDKGPGSLPRFGPREEPHLTGGHDLPQIYGQILTHENLMTQIRRLQALENDILEREHVCRVCEVKFLSQDADKILEHYRSHRASVQLCPYCQENWTEQNRQERIAHLAISHSGSHTQPKRDSCPFVGCTTNLSDNYLFPDQNEVSEHLRSHLDDLVNDNICSTTGCWTPLELLTNGQRAEHENMHKNPLKPPVHLQPIIQPPQRAPIRMQPVAQPQQSIDNQKKRKLCSICSADLTTAGNKRETAHLAKHERENAQILLMDEDEMAQGRASKGLAPKPAAQNKRKRETEDFSESEPIPKKRTTGAKGAGGARRQQNPQDDPEETTSRRSTRGRTPKK